MGEEEEEIEFNEGQEVEVAGECSNSNSWYSAKVIATFSGGKCKNMKKLLIEYASLIKSAKGLISPLRKIVDVARVRPRPPETPPETFYHLNQVVDVYFAKGWWKGKITEVVNSEELGYRVLLDSPTLSNRNMLVKGDDLRIHQDWAFGCWQQQQIEGIGKQTITVSDRTEGESEENFPDASVEGVSPENKLASHSNMSNSFSEVSDKDHKVYISFDMADYSMTLEGQINNGGQCYATIEDAKHEIVMHAPHHNEVTLLNRSGEHENFVLDPDCADLTLTNTNGEHETSTHDHDNDRWTPQNRAEQEIVMHDLSSMEVTPESRKNTVFTKSYSLWKDVEEMEEICLMTQQPHFQPLKETNVLLREGKAMGYMLSFADLVKETCRATLDEPKSTFESILQALNDLEAVGLNVQQVRDRLEELLRLKENQLQVHDMVKQCEGQIIKEKHEDELLKSEITNLDQKLLEINKRRQVVELEHNTRRSSITTLEKQLQDLMETIQGITRNFNVSAAAPW